MTEPKKHKHKKQKEKPSRTHPKRGEKLDEDDIIIEEMYNDCNHEKIKAEQNKKI